MASFSQTILIGNVGSDPEVRKLNNGDSVASVSLATSEKWKDKQTGQPQEKTEWHKLVFFGKLAEIVGQYVRKGMSIQVVGKNVTRKYQAQDGSDRYVTEVKCDHMQMLGGKQDGGAQGGGQAPQQQQQRAQAPQQRQQAPAQNMNDFDDDIPF